MHMHVTAYSCTDTPTIIHKLHYFKGLPKKDLLLAFFFKAEILILKNEVEHYPLAFKKKLVSPEILNKFIQH